MSVSEELNYSKVDVSHPTYTLSKLSPVEGSQDLVITSGGNQHTWELPALTPYNLAESYISLNVDTLTNSGANKSNFVPVDTCPMLSQIIIMTKGGLNLCYINFADLYLKIMGKSNTKISTMLSFDDSFGLVGPLNRSDLQSTANYRYNHTTAANNTATINFTEPLYLAYSGVGATGPSLNWRIPLSYFYDSILGVNKDLIFNEVLYLRIIYNPASKYAWSSDNVGGTVPQPGSNAVLNATYTVKLPTLYLAIEQKQEVINGLQSKLMSPEGVNMLIPYPYMQKANFSGTGVQSLSQRFTRANGERLLRIYYAFLLSNDTGVSSYDISNINGAKVSTFYTMLNNRRITQFDINCSTNFYEDYMSVKKLFDDNCIQNGNIYQYNWTWIENFASQEPLVYKNDVNDSKGLPLDVEQKYDFVATGAVATNHVPIAICQKRIVINSQGIQLI